MARIAVAMSGGVDSSYLAYYAVSKGLRPLVVHVDCGWNSEQAVRNIENVIKKLEYEPCGSFSPFFLSTIPTCFL